MQQNTFGSEGVIKSAALLPRQPLVDVEVSFSSLFFPSFFFFLYFFLLLSSFVLLSFVFLLRQPLVDIDVSCVILFLLLRDLNCQAII